MFDAVLEQIQSQANNVSPLGATVKFVLDEHTIYIDGTGESNVVSTDDKEAQCVVTTSLDTLQRLKSGALNPMTAMMTGKIKVKGDMGVAMKLQGAASLVGNGD